MAEGSSPLARGLRGASLKHFGCDRIIPARAGFTVEFLAQEEVQSDHPRSRGVYSRATSGRRSTAGSSPLARGLRRGPRDRHGRSGIIPARAGFTSAVRRSARLRQDHPRSRGVYKSAVHLSFTVAGSSPLARGLLDYRGRTPAGAGIIPARAGFTLPRAGSKSSRKDHPRSRGVYVVVSGGAAWRFGSSPLARGLLAFHTVIRANIGIIPARAGFT